APQSKPREGTSLSRLALTSCKATCCNHLCVVLPTEVGSTSSTRSASFTICRSRVPASLSSHGSSAPAARSRSGSTATSTTSSCDTSSSQSGGSQPGCRRLRCVPSQLPWVFCSTPSSSSCTALRADVAVPTGCP